MTKQGMAISIEVLNDGTALWRDVFLVFREGDLAHGVSTALEKYRLEREDVSLWDSNIRLGVAA